MMAPYLAAFSGPLFLARFLGNVFWKTFSRRLFLAAFSGPPFRP
jgi:hypothetical protein